MLLDGDLRRIFFYISPLAELLRMRKTHSNLIPLSSLSTHYHPFARKSLCSLPICSLIVEANQSAAGTQAKADMKGRFIGAGHCDAS